MSNTVENPKERSFGYAETTATWTTRYVDPSGFECMLSLQAESGSEALKKAEGAIAYLTEAKCVPFRKDSGNDRNHRQSKHSGATVLVKPEGDEKNPVCPLHGVEMQKWSRNGRVWYSHRWEDGWCNGKKP